MARGSSVMPVQVDPASGAIFAALELAEGF